MRSAKRSRTIALRMSLEQGATAPSG